MFTARPKTYRAILVREGALEFHFVLSKRLSCKNLFQF
ncbi:hypothetical protein LEP1GSC021_4852 [Leptospira noguchii str. 1993005606]|uniref:Uncharacterized protein n=2 Tax=Leptospira noguchii TaxID=28182 RepID=M6Y864_9LEPT|nr:hypothetical protein LEP1GSC035_3965 [Leptospira noguchii str. 2007001578]EMO89945.1 hypothetical protein LEP1GSC024_3190 [Leptospira noguchii str. 2001034031]EPE82424.1 hypothetical protein LEP1GSC021_4852 [Leptospira noguchii str. 1993005606]